MTLSFLSPSAALVGLLAFAGLAARARSERRSRELCAVLGLPPRRRLSLLGSGVAIALVGGLLALAAAQPVIANVSPRSGRTDAEAVFVFDISRSMLARPSPAAPSRFDRARQAAVEIRSSVPDVPAGVASMTDRVLPHLFPSIDGQAFSATVARALGIERPPPDRFGRGRATALGLLAALADRNFFEPSARHRVAVVYTDGESLPVDSAALRDRLEAGRVRVVFVRVWRSDERVFDANGRPVAAYRPDPESGPALAALARQIGARVFDESQTSEVVAAVHAALGHGPEGPQGRDLQSRQLAPFAVLAAGVPLLFLLWRRNF